ncbi:MAG TPA: hydrogenase [Elusimicrobiota bacterium]|nr:hydrogenase [Elusimicrobiota bacterium]
MADWLDLDNGTAASRTDIPVLGIAEVRTSLLTAIDDGARLLALFGDGADAPSTRLYALIGDASSGRLRIAAADVFGAYLSFTPECPQAHLFERELAEQYGVEPQGHPWLKPVRFTGRAPGVANFFRVSGEEVHEVAVGPVHAGVIEPGHFRFQCLGEDVLHLEIALGYQHRGIERALIGGPHSRSPHQMEALAGDASIGHATAYAQLLEALAGQDAPPRAEALRAIALEIERLANHIGDLGALSGDVGFLPTASYGGRIRGDFLNLSAELCGSRFGRGFVRPGGVGFDLDDARRRRMGTRLAEAAQAAAEAVQLLWDSPSVLSRFEGVGRLSPTLAEQLGLVGPVARASGLERDARFDFPSGFYRFAQIPLSTWHTGDVFSRAYLRWLEIQQSARFVRERLDALPQGPVRTTVPLAGANRVAVALVEGWRGEIVHVGLTDAQGRFSRYKIVDPSFHNWPALALAMRGGAISDFPLINKSFNLSYAGHDL